MKRLQRLLGDSRRRGLLAIACLALAYGTLVQSVGWNQTSHLALVRSLADGTAVIDPYHWQTGDKAYFEGHFYSVRPPGVAFLTLPLYLGLDGLGLIDALGFEQTAGGDPRQSQVPDSDVAMIWALGLLAAALPAAVLMLLVRWLAERVEPGFGTAAAVTLGLGTLMLPFATLLFAHALATALAFAAFAILWREREGPPRLTAVALAGLLAGLAVTAEYPLVLAGAILGAYAIARAGWLRRGSAYSGGVLAGVVPLLLYNLWAFGSITHVSYENAVRKQGRTGHDVLGLNDAGFFGVEMPSAKVGLELLIAPKGLLTLSPVLAAGVVGAVLLYRRGRRAETLVIGAMAFSYLVYNAGYYLPFGGGSPGPRFLIPILPFLALPLAIAYRRLPLTTLALAAGSAAAMVAATITVPLLEAPREIAVWGRRLAVGDLEPTIFGHAIGRKEGWLAIAPFMLLVGCAIALAVSATTRPRSERWDRGLAGAALVAWPCIAFVAAPPLGYPSLLERDGQAIAFLAGAALAGLLLSAAIWWAHSAASRRAPAPP